MDIAWVSFRGQRFISISPWNFASMPFRKTMEAALQVALRLFIFIFSSESLVAEQISPSEATKDSS